MSASKKNLTCRSVSLGLISEGHPHYDGIWLSCFYSARLYNVGLYNLRQQWINYRYFMPQKENYHWVKNNPNYAHLMSDQAQQTLNLVYRDMRSFFANLKEAKDSGANRKVRLPRYKPNEAKQGLALTITYGRCLRHTKKTEQGHVLRQRDTLLPFSRAFKESHPQCGEGIPLTLPKALVGKVINEVKLPILLNKWL